MFPRALVRAREQSARTDGPSAPSSAGSLPHAIKTFVIKLAKYINTYII
jgi:hypothetical protein